MSSTTTLLRPLIAGCLTVALAGAAHAQAVNLVQNGTFTSTTNGEGAYYTGTGTAPLGSTQATYWTACATTACNTADGDYPFIFIAAPGTANQTYKNTTSATLTGGVGFADPWDDPSGNGNDATGVAFRSLWGSANGGYGPSGTSSTGAWNGYGPGGTTDTSNILISDGDYHKTAINQTITGLVVGNYYAVTFDWAAGQWLNYSGATTEQWQVSLGSQTLGTSVYSLASHSFSGWMGATLVFTATSASEVLSFLAVGTPTGEPPILLLDDVGLYYAPEPGALALLGVGAACVAGLRRRRMARVVA